MPAGRRLSLPPTPRVPPIGPWTRRVLWWRRMWRTAFAHHPLCGRFRRSTVRLGPLRVCRSCLAMYAGLTAGLAALMSASVPAATVVGAFGVLAAVVIPASAAPLYRRVPRLGRDLLRAGLGLLIASWIGLLVHQLWLLGAISGLAGAAVRARVNAARRRAALRACDGCPQLDAPGVCDGYRLQMAALSRFQDDLAARLDARVSAVATLAPLNEPSTPK